MSAERHWVLVGLMGAGKTTVGRLLAERTGRTFVDNDAHLEDLTGATARQIEQRDGVDALHDREAGALLHALALPDPSVIAAAASVIEVAAVRAALAERAVVVWLAAPTDMLAARATSGRHRPLGTDVPAQLRAQAQARDPLYEQVADIEVDASRPPDAVLDDLVRRLGAPVR